MRKGIVLLLSLVMVFVMSAASFAADQEPAIIEDSIEEYSSVAGIDASLTRNGSAAISTIVVTEKVDLSSVKGTLTLVNSSGKKISSKNVTFTSHGTTFYNSTSFNLSKAGTYKVKFSITTYKGVAKKETINGNTNSIKK